MNTTVRNILSDWEKSLTRYNKLDEWQLCGNISELTNYVRSNDDSFEIKNQIREIRDNVVTNSFDSKVLMEKIGKVLSYFSIEEQEDHNKQSMARKNKRGQKVRYKNETRKIFCEKLKFKDGMPLRNFDIETESAKDSRLVRRIIEKRMCQAYHKMNHEDVEYTKCSNRGRYWMRRATSYQLYNIGQIENNNAPRGHFTHWKKIYDPITGEKVMKKKMTYQTEDEALYAIERWKIRHPEDHIKMQAYKCVTCEKWHIGHINTSLKNSDANIVGFNQTLSYTYFS